MEGSGKEREREILGFSTCMFGNSFLFDEFWSHTTPGMYSLAPSYDGGWGFWAWIKFVQTWEWNGMELELELDLGRNAIADETGT